MFLKRRSSVEKSSQPVPGGVEEPTRGWSDMKTCDAVLKVWVPQPLDRVLDQAVVQFGNSKVLIVRSALLIHVYGRYRLDQLVVHGLWGDHRSYDWKIRFSRAVDGPPRVAPRTEFIEQHGKSIEALRVHLPARLKVDLEALAARSGYRVSEYSRRVLIEYFFGRVDAPTLPDPPALLDESD